MTARSLVVHGHFYQPPREDPWSGRVPREASAAPWHDWNRRVHDECYRAVVGARILDGEGRVGGVVNALEWMSWDAGPTLLSWLARHEPETYRAFLRADARAVERTGHGNALACPYHHVILPLATRRDKVTQVRWGVADFRRRFGREPEGFWLPEAAVDAETLEVLAEEGLRFTVLGPGQVSRTPEGGLPATVELSEGRDIAVFVYDGPLSHDVAFGTLVEDAHSWVERMTRPDDGRSVVTMAADGETFGHHHAFADMALAALIRAVSLRDDARLESAAAVLARRPPEESVELVEPSSWSCAHGVGRWKENCGCRLDTSKPPAQEWRSVLRRGLDDLADELHRFYEDAAGELFRDPWKARDAYGAVLDAGRERRRRMLDRHAARPLDDAGFERASSLLEMERDALRMFTSCGWFFDDLGGLEPLQVLRYAAHALDILGDLGGDAEPLERALRGRLAEADGADPEEGDARRLWDEVVRGGRPRASADSVPAPSVDPADPEGSSLPTRPRTRPSVGRGPEGASARELGAAVRRLLRGPDPEAADEALRLADRADASGVALPFDVGTELAEALAREDAPDPVRRVAARLGFAPDGGPSTEVPGAPVRFVFGVHLHQPVGNFDDVFRSHADEVYLPLLRRAAERDFLPLALHVSGPLLEWLEREAHPLLELVGRLAADGRVELLLSGFYEPVLPALGRDDRLAQIAWMRAWLEGRFGVDARGLWLTERVWEPGLAGDLSDAGVEYVFVDDRHFLATGYRRHQLQRPWRTASDGKALSLLAIDERLRYLIPFRPTEEIGAYFRRLSAAGQPLAVLADDGEKFGGWPGTAEWVWENGWMDRFLERMARLRDKDVVRLVTPSEALAEVRPAGLAYLPSASYREMEGWSLPPEAAARRERLEEEIDEEETATRALVRGGHWRNFLTRYAESNRMHRKARALSALCRERGDPPEARRAVGRAQCNDAYWHGVFGGLYLPHLRAAVWENLAEAEGVLRAGEAPTAERLDLYGDGSEEIWVHGAAFSAVLRPARGGALTELVSFQRGQNLADVLTRRRESYHRWAEPGGGSAPASAPGDGEAEGGMPSIHEREGPVTFRTLPPFDLDERALLVDRILPGELDEDVYARADYDPLLSWARTAMEAEVESRAGGILVRLEVRPPGALEKELLFRADGSVRVGWRWDPADFPRDARFASELSLAHDAVLRWDPEPEAVWRHPIRTVSRSERGTEETVQGRAVTPLWPCRLGAAALEIRMGGPDPAGIQDPERAGP